MSRQNIATAELLASLDALPLGDRLAVPMTAFVMAAVDADVPREDMVAFLTDTIDRYGRILAEEQP
jgi:hypothetical protein